MTNERWVGNLTTTTSNTNDEHRQRVMVCIVNDTVEQLSLLCFVYRLTNNTCLHTAFNFFVSMCYLCFPV